MKGLIHIYTGEGKGKTTAAVGLTIRFLGSGGTCLFVQFLKGKDSGELSILNKLEGLTCLTGEKSFGFYDFMTEQTKKEAGEYYLNMFRQMKDMVKENEYQMVVLDEILGAVTNGFVPQRELECFLTEKKENLEVVMTGRNPSKELLDLADYISEIQKIKHPYDLGITARIGIER